MGTDDRGYLICSPNTFDVGSVTARPTPAAAHHTRPAKQHTTPSLAPHQVVGIPNAHIQQKRPADPSLAILSPAGLHSKQASTQASITRKPAEPRTTPALHAPTYWSHGGPRSPQVPPRQAPTAAHPTAQHRPSTGISESSDTSYQSFVAAMQHRRVTGSISSSKTSSGSGSAVGSHTPVLANQEATVAWGTSAAPASASSGTSGVSGLPSGPLLDEPLPGCMTDEDEDSDSEAEWADTDSDDRRVSHQAQKAMQLYTSSSIGAAARQQLEQARRGTPSGRPPLTPTRSLPHNATLLQNNNTLPHSITNSLRSHGTVPLAPLASNTSILSAVTTTSGRPKVLLPTDSTNLVFWGGVPIRRTPDPKHQNNTQLADVVGMTGRDGRAAESRPGTASSLWSAYDLGEGVLDRLQAQGMHRPGSKESPSRGAAIKTTSKTASSTGSRRGSLGGKAGNLSPARSLNKSPSLQAVARTTPAPCAPRVIHPAVVMDVSLMQLCPTPIDEVPLDEKGRTYPYVLPPMFPGACPTIAFAGSAAAMQASGLHPLMRVRMFVRYAGIANSPVKTAFKEAGWKVTKGGKKWTVCWGHIFSAKEFASLHEFQRVNHFPGTWEMGRKDYLYRNVAALKRIKGDALDFIPRFFILPRDRDEFQSELERHPGRLYIQKPVNSSRGRGVRMVTDAPALLKDATKELLVQHYVANPYTLNGFKFDMRLYVLATCMDPLRLYIYHEGLARLATQQYTQDKSELKKRCVHLTNYSVNKKSSGQAAEAQPGTQDDDDNTASKWSLAALKAHITQDKGPDAWQHVWRQVHDIVAGAMMSAEPKISTEVKMKVPHRNICFEVWGFDVLLDTSLRAWLMEVNTCPSLAADSPLDRRIKNSMVADAMNLVGPVPYDAQVYETFQEAKRQARLTGLPLTLPAGAAKKLVRSGSTCSEGGRSAGGGADVATLGQTGGGVQAPRTVREAEQIDYKGLLPDQLPDIVVEAEAEYARRRGWERVFPCIDDPARYLDLFETPRASAITLCKYYAQKAGGDLNTAGQGGAGRQTGSTGPAARVWPAIGTWRPGGFA